MDFTCIHGAGESVARRWLAAGCRSFDDLRQREDELGLTRTQRLGLKYVSDFKERIPRAEAMRIVDVVTSAADRAYGMNKVEVTPCGSMRRGAQTMSDIDIVLAPREGCVLAGGSLG
ncbi:DNA polymerase beta [Symbiodinium microadriaticum]|uniref:DNA polymerase n=1 Tax=Symbiodinium microadriaticum TaxID=2951 RepID=A0A1Q9C1I9_SYMMI|nr:DNA polymerase beta [Symbiodinium microadriaticum]